eukprot:4125852-Amphidinium_carterae.2
MPAPPRRHGYTDDCPGCKAARLGTPPQGRTAECTECRSRLVECMEREEEGRERLEQATARVGQTLPVEVGRVARRPEIKFKLFCVHGRSPH